MCWNYLALFRFQISDHVQPDLQIRLPAVVAWDGSRVEGESDSIEDRCVRGASDGIAEAIFTSHIGKRKRCIGLERQHRRLVNKHIVRQSPAQLSKRMAHTSTTQMNKAEDQQTEMVNMI